MSPTDRRTERRALTLALALPLALTLSVPTALASHSAAPAAQPDGTSAASWSDFNGDSFDDLAIGAPFDEVGGVAGAGVVHVIYGSANGLTTANAQIWHQNRPSIPDAAEQGDNFGRAVAAGDFNGDGKGDLAIGVPGEDGETPEEVNAGGIHLIFGSPAGLTEAGARYLEGDAFVFEPEERAQAGFALAALDAYEGQAAGSDELADLAVGYPGVLQNRGGFSILNSAFLTGDLMNSRIDSYSWTLDPAARMGSALASADLNDTGIDDLAVGVPRADVQTPAGTVSDAGTVWLVYDLESVAQLSQGPATTGHDLPEANDRFGEVLDTGDIDADFTDDLVVGVPSEDIFGITDAGLAHVFWGDEGGLTTGGDSVFWQESAGVPGTSGAGDRFGSAVVIEHFASPGFGAATAVPAPDGIPRKSLAVGIRGEDVNGIDQAGAIVLLYFDGFLRTVRDTGNQVWHQDSPNILEQAEPGDRFGQSLFAGAFGNGFEADLAVGVPFEDIGNIANAGLVHVFYGSSSGGLSTNEDLLFQDRPGIQETSQAGDRFGFSLGWRP